MNPETGQSAPGSSSQEAETIVVRVMEQLGVPCAQSGDNVNDLTKGIRDGGIAGSHGNYNKVGFDRLGLTLYAYTAVGAGLFHYIGYQYQRGKRYPVSQMKRDDLSPQDPNGHGYVVIYLDNGKMVEVPQSGSVVKTSPVCYNGTIPDVIRPVQFLTMCSTDQTTDLKKDFSVAYPTPTDRMDFKCAYTELGRAVVGQEHPIKQLSIAMPAGGYVLSESAPGVAKILAVSTFATTMDGSYPRIQFTSDLVLSNIVDTRISRQDISKFIIEPGPVISNTVFVDEVNRAPTKVRLVLLEVVAKCRVFITGESTPVFEPSLVLAMQSPIENQGVYPLPEAQRDRFLFKVLVGYPIPAEERGIAYRMGVIPLVAQQILTLESARELQRVTREVFIHHTLIDYVVAVIEFTHNPMQTELKDVDRWLSCGASPRIALGAITAAHAHALFSGRDRIVLGDVVSVLLSVLCHRLVLSYEGLADGVIPKRITGIVLSYMRLPQGIGIGSDEGATS